MSKRVDPLYVGWLVLFINFSYNLAAMKRLSYLLLLMSFTFCWSQENLPPFKKNQSYTYHQAHIEYQKLGQRYPDKCKFIQFGSSDHGEPIALFLINESGDFEPEIFRRKTVLLINNAIHAGEPCGVDASIALAKDLLASKIALPKNVVVGIIPVYNVGGALNRNCCSRANQNGPEMYGFRGNAKNLDLNRDFIKADSRNTFVFYKIFHHLQPDVFVDTHTSNGADYQHTMTLITSQLDKMHPTLHQYTEEKLQPFLFEQMDSSGYEMVPYVHQMGKTPEEGIFDYLETPRYSTGYTNLFNTISFVTETHMLKPYEDRVISTYLFLKHLINYMNEHNKELKAVRQEANHKTGHSEMVPINWRLDTTAYKTIEFKGYKPRYITSEVSGMDRLMYDRESPWTKEIRYYNHYLVTDSVRRPEYYIIPQAWKEVIFRLQMSEVPVYRLLNDTAYTCEVYYIDDYETMKRPYEGHYLHKNIKVSKTREDIQFYKGDYAIATRNPYAQFVINTLEPHAPDSYFAWNFFDAILQQKEWFSPYVFEDKAADILENDPELKAAFEQKKESDEAFAKDGFQQLYYIYKHSDNYERTHNQYPVFRFMDEINPGQIEKAPRLIGG